MVIVFCTTEEEEQLDSAALEGHVPAVGHFIDWQYDCSIARGVYRVERVEWTLMAGMCSAKLWIVPVP